MALRWIGSSGIVDLPNAANFAALPDPTTRLGLEYVVLAATGVWGINRKSAGIYYSDGTTWAFKGAAPNDAGLPTGGTTDQLLAKKSGTDFDYKYVDAPSGGGASDPLVLSSNDSIIAAPTDTTLKIFGKKRGGNRLFFNNKEGVGEELSAAFEQGWASILAVGTTGGLAQRGDGNPNVSLTGSSAATEAATVAAFGLTIPLSTSSGSGWRAGFIFVEKLFLYNSGFWGTSGVVTGYFATPAALTNLRIGVGLTGDTGITDACDNDVSTYSGLFINYSSARGDTNWKYWARNTAAPTVLDTGLPVLANKLYRYTLRLTKDPTIHILRIDNMNDNTSSGDRYITLAMPNASNGLQGIVYWKDLATTIRKAYLGKQIKRCMGVYSP